MPKSLRPLFFLLSIASTLIAAPAPEIKILTETELTFSAKGHTLPAPLIKARLYNTDGLLMVDTGSSHNVISRVFADAHHLAGIAAPAGRDHTGESVAIELAPAGYWQIGAITRTLSDSAIVAAPAAFALLGIVGFLSPQDFFERGVVILDFPAGRMLILSESTPDALRAWIRQNYPSTQSLTLPRATGPDPRKLYVQARLSAHDPIVAEIDTGGSVTEFDDALLPPSATALPPVSSLTVSGRKTSARTVDGQIVTLGGHNFGPLRVKARAPHANSAGLIGMDLLRHTVLVIPISAQEPLQLLVPRR